MEHGFKAHKIDQPDSGKYIRIRQRPPSAYTKGTFRTIEFGDFAKHGIKAIVGVPMPVKTKNPVDAYHLPDGTPLKGAALSDLKRYAKAINRPWQSLAARPDAAAQILAALDVLRAVKSDRKPSVAVFNAYSESLYPDFYISTSVVRGAFAALGVPYRNPRRRNAGPSVRVAAIKKVMPKSYSVREGRGSVKGEITISRPPDFDHIEWAKLSRMLRKKFPSVTFGGLAPEEFAVYWLDQKHNPKRNAGAMNTVKVIFANSRYNYTTSVSAQTSEADARKYFIGQYFDMGTFPKENMQRVIDIEYTRGNRSNPSILWGGGGEGFIKGEIKGTHDLFTLEQAFRGSPWALKYYIDGRSPGTTLESGHNVKQLKARAERHLNVLQQEADYYAQQDWDESRAGLPHKNRKNRRK